MRLRTIFLIFSLFVLAASALGQDVPPGDMDRPAARGEGRPNLLAELNLSPEQVQQIRQFNQERRPRMQEAQRRLRDANRALDMAIYADAVNESDVQAKLRDFQVAQAELAKLRFESELAIRKVLNPEQLTKFRDLRRQFEERMQKLRQNGRPGGRIRPRGGDPQRSPGQF